MADKFNDIDYNVVDKIYRYEDKGYWLIFIFLNIFYQFSTKKKEDNFFNKFILK